MSIPYSYGRNRNSSDPNAAPGGMPQQTLSHPDAKRLLWTGRVVYVDYIGMKCSVALDAGGGGIRHDVPLPAMGGAGPRSWSGSVLAQGARVILKWKSQGARSYQPHIVGVLSVGSQTSKYYLPFSTMSPEDREELLSQAPALADDINVIMDTVRLKYRPGYPGEFTAQSVQGSEIILDEDVYLSNRAGSEFRLRDSDLTSILKTGDEFVSNAAGNYSRGMIKRNAFTFYQDIFGLTDTEKSPRPYETVTDEGQFSRLVPNTSPAYPVLLKMGLINDDGSRTFDETFAKDSYPYVVAPNGYRINYVSPGLSQQGYSLKRSAYVEDRRELRHISDGGLAVSSEADGFGVDYQREVFIEDVHGSVVGNDFMTAEGRRFYKRLMKLKVFKSPDSQTYQASPIFESVDTTTDAGALEANSTALARLYRVKSPTTPGQQYVFAVTKEGRVMTHIPSSKSGTAQDRGKSLDANIEGLVKAIIGTDPSSGLSADITMNGGLKLSIGKSQTGASIDLTLAGPIRRTIIGGDFATNTPAEEAVINGNARTEITGSNYYYARGSQAFVSGGILTSQGNQVAQIAGLGGVRTQSAGDIQVLVLGGQKSSVALEATCIWGRGKTDTTLLGNDTTVVNVGSIARIVKVGAVENYKEEITPATVSTTMKVGSVSHKVETGSMAFTVVNTGSISFSNSQGPISSSSLSFSVSATAVAEISSPIVRIGNASLNAVAGAVGPGGPALDYLTGLPLLGLPNIFIG